MMDRPTFFAMLLGCVLALPIKAAAQPAGKIYRNGYLGNSAVNTPGTERIWNAFRQTLLHADEVIK